MNRPRGEGFAGMSEADQKRMMADAAAHERRQPADTHDIDAEEEKRKPLEEEEREAA